MDSNYTPATVSPYIPTRLIDDFERRFMEGFGISFQYVDNQWESPCFYLFMEDYQVFYTGDMTIADVLTSESPTAREIHSRLRIALPPEDFRPDVSLADVFDDLPTVEMTLQSILHKDQDDLNEIVIEGAYTCSKMRQGEFGGFVIRITKDITQYGGTASLLESWRKEQPINPTGEQNSHIPQGSEPTNQGAERIALVFCKGRRVGFSAREWANMALNPANESNEEV